LEFFRCGLLWRFVIFVGWKESLSSGSCTVSFRLDLSMCRCCEWLLVDRVVVVDGVLFSV
jgi:hypothetical protein